MLKKILLIIFTITILSCEAQNSETVIITTTSPLALILKEIAGPQIKVDYIVPASASPHTYSSKPSDVNKISKATAFFFIGKDVDSWASKYKSNNPIAMLMMIDPQFLVDRTTNNYLAINDSIKKDTQINWNIIDGHFWTDPVLIQALVPILVDTLSKIDPKNAQTYSENGKAFINKLTTLDRQISVMVKNIKNKAIYLHHPSFLYLINRYGLTYGGSIEKNPGQELTPMQLSELIAKIKADSVSAIFNELQLGRDEVNTIASETGVSVYLLDPLGADAKNYSDFIMNNIKKLIEALD